MSNYILVIIFTTLFLPGIVGIFLPILPSLPYMFVVALVFGIIDKFFHLTAFELIFLGLLAVVSFMVDYFSGVLAAKYSGASLAALLVGVIGLILGTIFFPPFGGLVGLFLGILAAELFLVRDYKKALKAATGGFLGQIAGIIANLILAIIFIVLFIIFALY